MAPPKCAVVVFESGNKKHYVGDLKDIQDLKPRHCEDFDRMKVYSVKWQESFHGTSADEYDDGCFGAKILCLGANSIELKGKMKKMNQKLPLNFPACSTSSATGRSKTGTGKKRKGNFKIQVKQTLVKPNKTAMATSSDKRQQKFLESAKRNPIFSASEQIERSEPLKEENKTVNSKRTTGVVKSTEHQPKLLEVPKGNSACDTSLVKREGKHHEKILVHDDKSKSDTEDLEISVEKPVTSSTADKENKDNQSPKNLSKVQDQGDKEQMSPRSASPALSIAETILASSDNEEQWGGSDTASETSVAAAYEFQQKLKELKKNHKQEIKMLQETIKVAKDKAFDYSKKLQAKQSEVVSLKRKNEEVTSELASLKYVFQDMKKFFLQSFDSSASKEKVMLDIDSYSGDSPYQLVASQQRKITHSTPSPHHHRKSSSMSAPVERKRETPSSELFEGLMKEISGGYATEEKVSRPLKGEASSPFLYSKSPASCSSSQNCPGGSSSVAKLDILKSSQKICVNTNLKVNRSLSFIPNGDKENKDLLPDGHRDFDEDAGNGFNEESNTIYSVDQLCELVLLDLNEEKTFTADGKGNVQIGNYLVNQEGWKLKVKPQKKDSKYAKELASCLWTHEAMAKRTVKGRTKSDKQPATPEKLDLVKGAFMARLKKKGFNMPKQELDTFVSSQVEHFLAEKFTDEARQPRIKKAKLD